MSPAGGAHHDLHVIGNASIGKITVFSLAAIVIMLLIVYRSIVTTLVQLFLTGIGLAAARGVIAVLGNYNVMGLTTFATNILTMLGIAAATDYGYSRSAVTVKRVRPVEDRESAWLHHVSFRRSGDHWFGADDRRGDVLSELVGCRTFPRWVTRRPGNAGPGGAGDRWGRRYCSSAACGFVRIQASPGPTVAAGGTAVVRWPAPILVASAVVVLLGMVALPGYTTSYNDRFYLPANAPANLGYAAADRHFTQARMNPTS